MCDNGTNYFRCKECCWESHESVNPELRPEECPDCGCTEFEELDLEDEMYKQYRRKQIAELADWTPDIDMTGVSISEADVKNGSPKSGDKIARNPKNHDDRWLVAEKYFNDNFEPIG